MQSETLVPITASARPQAAGVGRVPDSDKSASGCTGQRMTRRQSMIALLVSLIAVSWLLLLVDIEYIPVRRYLQAASQWSSYDSAVDNQWIEEFTQDLIDSPEDVASASMILPPLQHSQAPINASKLEPPPKSTNPLDLEYFPLAAPFPSMFYEKGLFKQRYLVAIVVGNRSADMLTELINKWGLDQFNYMLFVNEPWPEYHLQPWAPRVIMIFHLAKMRFWFYTHFLTSKIVSSYRYVLLVEADVSVSTFNHQQFIDVLEAVQPALAQAGIVSDSLVTHRDPAVTRQHDGGHARDHTGRWTGILGLGPVVAVRRDAWSCLLRWIGRDIATGTGLEPLWCGIVATECPAVSSGRWPLNAPSNTGCVVVDSVPVQRNASNPLEQTVPHAWSVSAARSDQHSLHKRCKEGALAPDSKLPSKATSQFATWTVANATEWLRYCGSQRLPGFQQRFLLSTKVEL